MRANPLVYPRLAYKPAVLLSLLTYFPSNVLAGVAGTQLPVVFPSPFAVIPHPIAIAAAEIVRRDLSLANPEGHDFSKSGSGKMIGVLVVQDANHKTAFLRAVSGMLSREWLVDGFVPPLFDVAERSAFWPAGQVRLDELGAQAKALAQGPIATLQAERKRLTKRHADELETLATAMRARKEARAQQRNVLSEQNSDELMRTKKMAELSSESQRDRKTSKAKKAEQRAELLELRLRQDALEAERLQIRGLQKNVSNSLLDKIQLGYSICNHKGESRPLASFFHPAVPPGGSGDCAAPKLLGYANSNGLRPIALAEFWWGASPAGAVRHHESFYPPCKGRCQPILPYMLSGVELEEAPVYGESIADESEPELVFEDDFLVVVNKPSGMLSVPGASPLLQDSVLTRLRARYPEASGALLVHRLDLDTSGLLIMAKNSDTFSALQEQFAQRLVEKKYLAWLDGDVPDKGSVDLPLRVDLEDRPRQIVCFEHGKSAQTDYEVIERKNGRTLVRFSPRSGRTHQLRVHASHANGLSAPIVGDRLYGRPGGRLLLHAQSLAFVHPASGEQVRIECPLPSDWPG